jgi:hypothetical protein
LIIAIIGAWLGISKLAARCDEFAERVYLSTDDVEMSIEPEPTNYQRPFFMLECLLYLSEDEARVRLQDLIALCREHAVQATLESVYVSRDDNGNTKIITDDIYMETP